MGKGGRRKGEKEGGGRGGSKGDMNIEQCLRDADESEYKREGEEIEERWEEGGRGKKEECLNSRK